MASKNPYQTNKAFPVSYEGAQGGFHCYRIGLRGFKALEALAVKRQVTSWLLGCTDGEQYSGHVFCDLKKLPKVEFTNEGHVDYFVLLNSMDDIERFEDNFSVVGYSPTLVA